MVYWPRSGWWETTGDYENMVSDFCTPSHQLPLPPAPYPPPHAPLNFSELNTDGLFSVADSKIVLSP